MSTIILIQIDLHGHPVMAAGKLDDIAQQVCAATALLYRTTGFVPPWVGYLARIDNRVVGACAFKAPPENDKVEIGYFTFPDDEGRGVGTKMVRELLHIVRAQNPTLTVVAQTASEENASNAILRKFGFQRVRSVQDAEGEEMWEWQLNNVTLALEHKHV
jgi:ribosomal-protein-alanine N-acetyltransferase